MTFGPIKTRKYEEMTPTDSSSIPQFRVEFPSQLRRVQFRAELPQQYPSGVPEDRGIREDAQPDEDTGTHHHQDGTTTSSPEEDLAATPTPQRPA